MRKSFNNIDKELDLSSTNQERDQQTQSINLLGAIRSQLKNKRFIIIITSHVDKNYLNKLEDGKALM